MNNGEGKKDTSNSSQKIVGEELMVEAELMAEESKGNKRRKHAEKNGDKEDKEDLPGSKKVKKHPRKNKPNKRGRPSGKNKENKEKCIFCQEEYLRKTLWEDVGQEKPNILQVSICGSCHVCLKDDVVMKEIREIIKKAVLN